MDANALLQEAGPDALVRAFDRGLMARPRMDVAEPLNGHSGTDAGGSWNEEPSPLTRELPPADPFPIDALGSMKDAVLAIQAATQAPMAICANAVIATVALAGQAHVDVTLPTGQTKPISVNILTIALSGERKTSVDGYAISPVRSRQDYLRDIYRREIERYVADHKAWEGESRKIANSAKLGFEEKKRKIAQLGPEPPAPKQPLLIIHEPTVEGLAKLLQDGQPSIGIFTSEGGAFIGGHGFTDDAKLRTAAILSLLWDDGSISRVRASDGAQVIDGKRVSMHLQAQPDVGARFFADRVLVDQGLVWRFLVSAPDSTQGQRFWRERDLGHNSAIDFYNQKISILLNTPPPLKPGTCNELSPRPLKLSPDARPFWIACSNEIEGRVTPDGDLRPIAGFANKLLEHATRLAGILTVYEDINAKEISLAAMQNGFALATHYAQTGLRLSLAARVNAGLLEAEALRRWLQDKWSPENGSVISIPDLVQRGPNSVRDTSKARHFIGILERHGYLRRTTKTVMGKKRREAWEIRSKL